MSPPSDTTLREIRHRIQLAHPVPEQPRNAVSAPSAKRSDTARTAPPVLNPEPTPEELQQEPGLDDYRDLRDQGATHLRRLAEWLEARGHEQRAWLAWERVIDSSTPSPEESAAAIAAINRLAAGNRPWNHEHSTAVPITLHAGTDPPTAAAIRPVLEEMARNLELASSGILRVDVEIAVGLTSLNPGGPSPVALWMAAPAHDSASTDVLSISVEPAAPTRDAVERTIYRIIRGYLARTTPLQPPPPLQDTDPPLESIQTRITRLGWSLIGSRLHESD